MQGEVARPTGMCGNRLRRLCLSQLAEISTSKEGMTAEARQRVRGGALIEMDELEIVGQAEQAPELFFGHDRAERAHRLRLTAGIRTPPWPRDIEQRFRRNIADERLVRRIGDGLRVRAQMLLHRRQ